jgi:hypothetical protein
VSSGTAVTLGLGYASLVLEGPWHAVPIMNPEPLVESKRRANVLGLDLPLMVQCSTCLRLWKASDLAWLDQISWDHDCSEDIP